MMTDQFTESVLQAVKNFTETIIQAKINSILELAVTYGSLVIMAMLPIYLGAQRSIRNPKLKKDSGKMADYMTTKDALMFPIIASCALFGLYMFFKIFSKDYINLLFTGYFFFLGVMALSHLLSPVIGSLIPTAIPKIPFHILFTQGERNKKDLINYKFTTHELVSLVISTVIGVWYVLKKHWIANNLFGFAFAVNGIELLHLTNVLTGCILLGGLFIYDIYWVFGTNVMFTVTKSFEAPIQLISPQHLIKNGISSPKFTMLGLGDIVIPGIFIALLLRFDNSLKRKSKIYFYSTFIAYFLGLLTTILVMHVFNHGQPALLYLVPVCIGTPILLALIKGDTKILFAYEDHPKDMEKGKEK